MILHPKVSIIIPVYNTEKYIKETIDSVLNQNFKDFEIIVVDDCSKDESLKIIKEIAKKDKRIKIFKNKKNKGRASAVNIGFKHARGEYITFSDADDLFYPKRLKQQVEFLDKHTKIDMIYGDLVKLFENRKEKFRKSVEFKDLKEPLIKLKKVAKSKEKFKDAFKILNEKDYIPGTSVIFRRKIIDKGIKMDEKIIYEDCDFNFQVIGSGYKILKQPIITFKYRIYPGQKTKSVNIPFATDQILNKLRKGKYFK